MSFFNKHDQRWQLKFFWILRCERIFKSVPENQKMKILGVKKNGNSDEEFRPSRI